MIQGARCRKPTRIGRWEMLGEAAARVVERLTAGLVARLGKSPHAAALHCADCGCHRTARARHRAPSGENYNDLRAQRQHRQRVRERPQTEDAHPDRTGSAKIGGAEYWISGWLRTTKKGQPYLSLSFKTKNADNAKPKHSPRDDLNDPVPF